MTLTENIIREFKDLQKESFSREEVIKIIRGCTSSHYRPDLESNGILVSPEKHAIYINGKKKMAAKRVFDLLYYLIENKNQVSTKENILRDVWGTDVCVSPRTIDVHIRKIKIALEDDDCIKSIKRVGYKWVK
jgi:DNA-binding response OmpR family regulator